MVLTLALAACDGAETTGHDASALHGDIDDGRREADRHHAAVGSMQSMGEMEAEMQLHDGAMDGVMASVDGAMDGMSGCMGDSSSMTEIMEMMGMMASMMDEHREAMAGADEVSVAQAESDEHHAAMMDLLDGMEGTVATMGCSQMH
jgi:hypothetical protein